MRHSRPGVVVGSERDERQVACGECGSFDCDGDDAAYDNGGDYDYSCCLHEHDDDDTCDDAYDYVCCYAYDDYDYYDYYDYGDDDHYYCYDYYY